MSASDYAERRWRRKYSAISALVRLEDYRCDVPAQRLVMMAMETTDWSNVLELIDAALWAGILFPEHLPDVAAQLLAAGADSPALRVLAGADLEPTDPRDFRDLFLVLLEEQSLEELAVDRRVQIAAQLVAVAVVSGRIGLKDGVRRASGLVVAARYPDNPDLMGLFSLSDEWEGSWGSPPVELEKEAKAIFSRLAQDAPPAPSFLIDAVVKSR
jgi:hypothetical protein